MKVSICAAGQSEGGTLCEAERPVQLPVTSGCYLSHLPFGFWAAAVHCGVLIGGCASFYIFTGCIAQVDTKSRSSRRWRNHCVSARRRLTRTPQRSKHGGCSSSSSGRRRRRRRRREKVTASAAAAAAAEEAAAGGRGGAAAPGGGAAAATAGGSLLLLKRDGEIEVSSAVQQ